MKYVSYLNKHGTINLYNTPQSLYSNYLLRYKTLILKNLPCLTLNRDQTRINCGYFTKFRFWKYHMF